MFQISTMANFETEVYELLNLFDSSGDKHDEKISSSLCTDRPPPPPSLKESRGVCTQAITRENIGKQR